LRRTVDLFLKLLAIICALLFFLWSVFALNYVTYFKLSWETVLIAVIGIVGYGLLKIKRFKIFELLYKWRYLIIVVLVICQLGFVLLASGLAGADTTGVFESVQGISAPEYFSPFTNNYLYGLYVKGIIAIVGPHYAILAQEIINIVMLDSVLLFVPRCLGRYVSKDAAYKSFLLLVLTVGINPTILSTYTDYLSLFTASLIFCLSLKIMRTRLKLYELLVFGMVIAIGSEIRVTSLIFVIGLVMVVSLNYFRGLPNLKKLHLPTCLAIGMIILGFSILPLC
jgi:hypothetical protein